MHRIIQRCAWELSVCSMARLPAVVMLRGGEPDEKIAKNVRLDIEKVREARAVWEEKGWTCLIRNPRGDMEEGDTMSEENILNDISALIAQFEEQKKMIYSHYIQAVAKVVAGRITAEKEIERIMDGLLNFGDDEKFLALYKKLCHHVYNFYPQMVGEHIAIFRMQFEEKEEKKNGND